MVANFMCAPLTGNDIAQPVAIGQDGKLVYEHDEQGNRVPDFSHCGYAKADREIPNVAAVVVVTPIDGDDGPQIQGAIDAVAKLAQKASGYRGAVLLGPGQFEIASKLRITAPGIVLRGAGAGENGTVLVATGTDRRTLIQVEGVDDRQIDDERAAQVVDEYVPVGSTRMRVNSAREFAVGDAILVTRPSTLDWITALGMDAFGVVWKPGTRDIRWDRTITHIDGKAITIDAPITTALEKRFGGATIRRYQWPGRIFNVGIEDLQLRSAYDKTNLHDEDHAWFGIVMNNVEDAWVRRVEFRHFAGGAVSLLENSRRITVEDCISCAPVSELGGYRRHTFFTQGELALFLRCWSEQGRHDFAVGHCAPGPNAFVNCYADQARSASGPIESWASGVLWDNVRIDGSNICLENRWSDPPGTGWSAANCMLWQCQAAVVRCFRPPMANNWAMGAWARFAGDGSFAGRSDFVEPISLYHAQLRDRRGKSAARHVEPGLIDPIGSTNPTLEQAAHFTKQSEKPATQLVDVIRSRYEAARAVQVVGIHSLPKGSELPSYEEGPLHESQQLPSTSGALHIENGWLVIDGQLKTGASILQRFWRGTIRPDEAGAFGPALTRFVPGRTGTGFTDDLEQLVDTMRDNDIAVFDHHYGLWYDRRRDDHLMVRRASGDVAPPFYEQPFARSGQGNAWDGLSKYDLTKFNPWYWQRLRNFARLADDRGLVLLHQGYFQHNILEAGAHWADSPWRPANNVNESGLPEPPPFVGDKRIFLAHQYYDIADPRRRALHRRYIRKCLENFADCTNVIHMTSAEYTGPLEFMQFWMDTIIDWREEQRRSGRERDTLVGLSATKDVQDAILADPRRGPHVDVIDIRYWCYAEDGNLYAPSGGKNLAPRQHMRQLKPEASSFASIVRAVREYRIRYPDKAVTYYADQYCRSGRDGWAVLIGGGSLANAKLPGKLAAIIPTMRPVDGVVAGDDQWCLGNDNGDYLIYSDSSDETVNITGLDDGGTYHAIWIDADTGELASETELNLKVPITVRKRSKALWLARARS